MNLNEELRKENAELRRQLSETAHLAYLRLQTLKKWQTKTLKLRKQLKEAKSIRASNIDVRPFGE